MANDIIGVKEVKKLLEEAGKAPAKVLTTSTKKGARIALAYAKAHVYDGFEEQTGTLKRSLKIRKEKRKKGKSVYQVGPDASGWYAHFLDFGHWNTGGVKLAKKGTAARDAQTSGMTWNPGNRFLRNSVDIQRDGIEQIILEDMAKELDKLR